MCVKLQNGSVLSADMQIPRSSRAILCCVTGKSSETLGVHGDKSENEVLDDEVVPQSLITSGQSLGGATLGSQLLHVWLQGAPLAYTVAVTRTSLHAWSVP
jgi:hypothetical protein